MTTLGRLLLERGWVTEAQLAAALERQQQRGHRLGTCLLESGAIAEDLLLKSLGEQYGVPVADIEDLRDIPEQVRSLIPVRLAIGCEAVPLRVVGNSVDIAMSDVRNLAQQDEIAFVLGKRLNLHIAHEARIVEALARYYGMDCPLRFGSLLERLNRARDGWGAGETGLGPKPAGEPEPARGSPLPSASPPAAGGLPWRRAPTVPPKPVAQTSIPLTPEERQALEGGAAAPVPATSPEEPRAALEALFDDAETPQLVGRAILDALSQQFVRSLLFRVSRGEVTGWLSRAPQVDPERFQDFRVDLSAPSVFRAITTGGNLFIGTLPELPANDDLVALWGGDLQTDCLLCAISVRDKPVCIAYGDRDSLGVTGVELDRIHLVASLASRAFERCILRRKRQAGSVR